MSDRALIRRRPTVAAAAPNVPEVLTASAQLLRGFAREAYATQYRSWQDELWAYTTTVGQYGSVMDWFAAGVSRMHLVAAIKRPGQREPEIIDDDSVPAVQLIHRLITNAKNGETQFLYKLGRQLGIPGVGIFLGWQRPDGREVFDIKSVKQIRRSTIPFKDVSGYVLHRNDGTPMVGYDLEVEPGIWEKLPINQLVGRIYRPDDQLDYEVTSWSRAALTTLREIDLLNRHIVATLLSRLVFNGILLIPEEITFPVNEEFKEAADPFISELIAVASRGIRDPGSPASAIPFPLRVKSEFIDKFQHLILSSGIDPKIIEARAAAIENLSRELPAPPETMTGNSSANHWSAWKTSEDNAKYYFGPTMEIGCGGIDDTYLHPMLLAAGESIDAPDGGRYVTWYDATDLIVQPDNSENAQEAFDKASISEEVYRTAVGFDEEDAPNKDEKREIILTSLATQGLPIPDSFYLLYPEDKPDPMEQAVEQGNAMAAQNEILGIDPAAGAAPSAGPSGKAPAAATKTNSAPAKPTGTDPAKAGVRKPAGAANKAKGA